MKRRADIINWVVLLLVSVGMTMYLVSASRLVANEQDNITTVWTSVGSYEASQKKIIGNEER